MYQTGNRKPIHMRGIGARNRMNTGDLRNEDITEGDAQSALRAYLAKYRNFTHEAIQ